MRLTYPPKTGDRTTDTTYQQVLENMGELSRLAYKQGQDLATVQQQLQSQLDQLKAAAAATPTAPTKKSKSGSSGTLDTMIGAALAPQPAGVPFFTANPPVSHPITQQTQLILVGATPATASLKYADPTTDPPNWVTVATGSSSSGIFVTSITASASTSSTNDVNVAVLPLSAGQLNTVGKRMRLTSFGNVTADVANRSINLTAWLTPHPATNPPNLVNSQFLGAWAVLLPSGSSYNWVANSEVVIIASGANGDLHAGGPFMISFDQTLTAAINTNVFNNGTVVGRTLLNLAGQFDVVWTARVFNAAQTFRIDYASVEILN